jgi:hypothetical protein
MEKKHLEIGISTSLVILMIAIMLAVQIVAPVSLRSTGFVFIMLAFMVVMGFVGVRLLDM